MRDSNRSRYFLLETDGPAHEAAEEGVVEDVVATVADLTVAGLVADLTVVVVAADWTVADLPAVVDLTVVVVVVDLTVADLNIADLTVVDLIVVVAYCMKGQLLWQNNHDELNYWFLQLIKV